MTEALDQLAEICSAVAFHNWGFTAAEDDRELTLTITMPQVVDTYDWYQNLDLSMTLALPRADVLACDDPPRLLHQFVYASIVQLLEHEAAEYLLIDGVRVFDPHRRGDPVYARDRPARLVRDSAFYGPGMPF